MRLAEVFPRPAVFVDSIDMQIAVRVPRFVLCHRTEDVYRSAAIEVRREAVVCSRRRCCKQNQ
jgi:hypothetical protein